MYKYCTLGQQPATEKRVVTNRPTIASEQNGLSRICPRNTITDYDLRTRNKQLRFGTWNVRTLSTPSASDILSDELNNYRMDLVALQEVKWPYDGKESTQHYKLYYSGNQTGKHEYGVAFAVRNNLDSAVIDFKAINQRLCTIRLKGRFKNISLVCIYAPIENADDDIKDDFYETLEEALNKLPNYDIKIILGDANAHVGKERIWHNVAGKESLHDVTNDNGTRLLNLAIGRNMKVVSTYFPRKNIHKETWNHPNGFSKSQIDHVLIDNRHKKNISNVRSIRKAEIGSDHNLVLIKIYQRLATEKCDSSKMGKIMDSEILKDPIKAHEFKSNVESKLRSIETNEIDIDKRWEQLRNILQESAKEICGEKIKKRGKPWFDQDCSEIIDKRRKLREKWLETKHVNDKKTYDDINKETTKLLRKKKRNWLKGLVTRAEEERTANNSRDFYRTTRFFRTEYKPKAYGIKDKNGTVILQQKEGLNRWQEYFDELLNGQPRQQLEELPKYQNVQPQIEKPSLNEISEAIKTLKNNKAPGEDTINAEIIKAGKEVVAREIHKLILDIWERREIPREWKEAIVIPIHKKGDKQDCNNYRGISLQNVSYKVFSKVLLNRLENYTNSIIEEHQSGFIKGRSTTDQTFIVKESIAKYWEFDKDCFLLFVDFNKAYDSLDRQQIWHKMEKFGIPLEMIELIKLTVQDSKCKVKVNGQVSSSFKVNTGVRQGDGLSPTLFNIALEETLQKVNNSNGGIHIGKRFNVLAFADDIVVIAETLNDIKEITKILIQETDIVGLKINEAKTKVMHITRNSIITANQVQIESHTFDMVSTFKYLGVTLSDRNEEDIEIQIRINSANRSFYACQKLMSSKLLSKCSKIRIYKTIIRPVLMYGCESWIMTKRTKTKIITFENKILRKIYGPTLEDGIWRIKHNREIRTLYKEPDVVSEVRHNRLRWAGHVIRRDSESTINNVWKNIPDGKRPKGRPKMRWCDQVMEDIRTCNLTTDDAMDRNKWRQYIGEAKYRLGYKWPWE